MKEKCNETARIILPWGNELLNYCPVHANKLVILANAMGSPIQAQLLPKNSVLECQSNEVLTDTEKKLVKTFHL